MDHAGRQLARPSRFEKRQFLAELGCQAGLQFTGALSAALIERTPSGNPESVAPNHIE